MYKELEKYKTGKKVPTPGIVVNVSPQREVTIDLDEYCFPLGNVLNDFMKHQNYKFWKKLKYGSWYYDSLTKAYVEILNLWGKVNYSKW